MTQHEKITRLRKELGLTQATVAGLLGLSLRTYQRYEHGDTSISDENLNKIAKLLNTDAQSLKADSNESSAEINKLVNIILEKFGPQHQAIILIEEMSELTKVLCKIQRGKFSRGKLNEEFTHVRVSCEVIRRIMQIKDQDVSEQVRAKLEEYADSAMLRS